MQRKIHYFRLIDSVTLMMPTLIYTLNTTQIKILADAFVAVDI